MADRMRHTLAAVAVSSLMLISTGCGSNEVNHNGTGSPAATTPASEAVFNDADVMFAQMMIPHHQQAVEMSTLAETRAQDLEVKRLAATIKAAQQPEIDKMTAWLTAWGKPTTAPTDRPDMGPGGHAMSGMMTHEEMSELAAAQGNEFDRKFAQMMIAHHNGAVQMAQDEVRGGSSQDAIGLARNIVKTQMAEVVILQKIADRL